MNSKLHYKMFKAGKKWVFASIAAAGLGIVALDANATNVHADSANNDAADSIDDSTTTSPVSSASVTLTTTSLKTSSATSSSTTSVTSSATSSAVQSSATKMAVSSVASSSASKSDASSVASSVAEKTSVASSSAVKVATSSSSASSSVISAGSITSSATSSSSAVQSSSTKDSSSTSSSAKIDTKVTSSANSSATAKSSAFSKPASSALTSKSKTKDKNKNTSKDYTIDNSHKLADGEGSDQQTKNNVIIAHATGTYAPAENVAIYEKREWDSSQTYVQYIVGDGGKVYAVGEEGYVAWGAGEWANENAPVQVELAQTYSNSQFKKDYQTYVNLLRDSAKKWNIPTTLDSKEYRGIKSHLWVTNHVWGDHVDPYGYLSTHGISQAQFAHDLQYGFGNNTNNDSKNNKPSNNDGKKDSNNNNSKNNTSKFHVGDKVTIKTSAKHWATGQSIYSAVKGKTYKVLQVNGNRLLLDKVVSWINTSNVTLAGSSSHHSSSNSNGSKNNSNNSSKSSKITVGTKVTIKSSAKHWATGQTIYGAVKGKTYKVIQVNGNRLLLDKVISWINKSDVTVPGSSSNHSSSNNSSKSNSNKGNSSNSNKSAKIKVGSKVTIKTSAKHWATGQTIYSAVKGKTYKVIQINGNRLLLDKVVSWINKGDVTVPGSSSNHSSSNKNNSNNSNKNQSKKIGVGSKVTIKKTAKHWATGQSIYSAVKGKTYKVIQVNGNRLLLDKVISWIDKSNVTLAGSSSNSSNKHNSSSKAHNVNVHLTNKRWTTAQTNFVNSIAADIVNVCNNNNLYASVAMAQAVLESGYGTSSLAQSAHNLFGIKADSTWKGATYTKSTKEVINGRTVTVNASFRKYSSIKDSIADYAKKLESRAQYANAFANKSANYVASIKAIKAGGYATSTTYVSSIVNCINSNGFFKLDGLSKAIYL